MKTKIGSFITFITPVYYWKYNQTEFLYFKALFPIISDQKSWEVKVLMIGLLPILWFPEKNELQRDGR